MRRRKRLLQDLDRDIGEHIERETADNIERGMAPEEARYAALRKFGNMARAKEDTRAVWRWLWIEQFLQDVRYGARILRKAPGFTLVAVCTLALGIGASITIFSWVRGVLLNPLPGTSDPQRVVALETTTPDGGWKDTSYLDFRDLRSNCKLVESMSVVKPLPLAIGNETNSERVWGEAVSGNLLELLRVRPELGRFFTSIEVDHQQNAHPLVIISHAFWSSRYHADPRALGATLRINRLPYTVIGVTPEAFHGATPGVTFDLWVPATMFGQLTSTGDSALVDRKWRTFGVLARLAPGVSIEQARAEVESHARDMARENADTNEGMSATLLPLWKSHGGIQESLAGPLSILMAACGVLLLIVSANVANLLLARATTRQKEFSIRRSLGAPRWRLIRQVLTESSLIAAMGTVAGLAAANWLRGSLGWLLPRSSAPTLAQAPIDVEVVLFAIALAFGVALLAGITPALQSGGENIESMLKQGGRSGTSAHSRRLRGFIVTSEIALATLALIGAGLCVKSFRRVSAIGPGFDPEHVAIAQLGLSAAGYNAQQADAFCRRLRQQLERQPGITAVSYDDYVPLSVSAGSWEDLQIQGYISRPSENMKVYRSLVSPGYFSLIRIPLLEGRDFDMRDDMASQPVMIVNQEFVRRFIPNGVAIGRQVRGWGRWFTIIGVAQDSKIYRLTEVRTPYFYVSIRQIYRPEMGLVFYIRTTGSIETGIETLRREAQAADPSIPVFDAISLTDIISSSLFIQKISASLLSVLGGIALLLASSGLGGVIGYSVAQRTNEIGIRMALGAGRMSVFRTVLGEGASLAALGIAIGSTAALGVTRLMASVLYGVRAADPLTFGGVSLLLLVVTLVACYVPARRAMRVDPIVALRYE